MITASIADIIANYSFKDILRKLAREKQTEVAPASYDDSYLGEIHARDICGCSKDNVLNVDANSILHVLLLFGILFKFSFLIS